MASLIDAALLNKKVVYVDTNNPPDDNALIDAGIANADTIYYYGNGTIKSTDIVSLRALKGEHTVITGGASVTANAGLLDLSVLSQHTVVIDGDSSFEIDAAGLSVGGILTDLLNKTEIAFTGAKAGTFTFSPPTVGLLTNTAITVSQMGLGDKIVIPFSGDNGLLSPGGHMLREAAAGYKDGYLHLVNGVPLVSTVQVKIKMSQEEYDRYAANKSLYLDGKNDIFYFPGAQDDGGDYEGPLDPPCFTRGVMIETPDGLVCVENLKVGDLVMTKDNGPQPVRWIASRLVGTVELISRPNIRPIRVSAGALGENSPQVDMLLSPQHRVMIRSRIAQKMFDADEVLVAVKQLLQLDGIDIVNDFKPVEYYHLLFDQHEVVYANGAEAESLYPGPMAIKAIGPAAYEEICTLFPEMAAEDYVPIAAREILSGRMARKLAVFHKQAGVPLNS